MGNAYEIYALRYATMARTPHMNFITPDPHDTSAQDLDYFVWLIRGLGRNILVDTGFNAEEAQLRGRKLMLNPVDALAGFGVKAEDIADVIVTHLHYDHAGNLDRFPKARFHLQEREMSYATGRCMCNAHLRHPFTVEHVTQMVRHVYGERVTFHSGDGEVAPGVTVHRVGGHSDGLQVVRVGTERAITAPSVRNRASGSGARSNAITTAPVFLTRLRQIGSPITPRPIKPMVFCSDICWVLFTCYLLNERDGVRCNAKASTLSLARG